MTLKSIIDLKGYDDNYFIVTTSVSGLIENNFD